MRFFVGLHCPSHAQHFDAVCLSVNRLRKRKADVPIRGDWLLDSAAFTTIATHGGFPHPPSEYAEQINRWRRCGRMLAAVSQDYMTEPAMLERTGLNIAEHQRLTIERFLALRALTPAYVMPVLQGWSATDYLAHLRAYGPLLERGAWVGVGSVCKRQGDPRAIAEVLLAIHRERPDLRLHGFGIKSTALADPLCRELLHSADSMAWSYHARINGRNGNDWREARAWTDKIESRPQQSTWVFA